MVHSFRISGGECQYSNRWARTARFLKEREAGHPVFIKFGDFPGVQGLVRMLLVEPFKALFLGKDGSGQANTNIMYHAGKILALHEGDLPYEMRVLSSGLVDDWRRMSWLAGPFGKTFQAHPKRCHATDELHFMRYDMARKPYLTYGQLDRVGKLVKVVPVDIPAPVVAHDFAISERYALFMDFPLEVDPAKLLDLSTLPMAVKQRPSRIGVLPRAAASDAEIVWFSCPDARVCVHTFNAWEEGDTLKLAMCTYTNLTFNFMDEEMTDEERIARGPRSRATVAEMDVSPGAWAQYRSGEREATFEFRQMHPDFVTASGRELHIAPDFPRIRDDLTGRPARWGYCANLANTDVLGFDALMKFDLLEPSGGRRDRHLRHTVALEPGAGCGEPVFAPRAGGRREDDGYLLAHVHKDGAERSELRVWDARTMRQVCRIETPQRVPWGFHGAWVTEAELRRHLGE